MDSVLWGWSSGDGEPRWLLAVGLAIAYLPIYVAPVFGLAGFALRLQGPPSVILWNWVAVVLLLAFVRRVEDRALASIRLARPTARDVGWAVLFGVTGIVVQMAVTVLFEPPSGNLGSLLELSLPVIVALVLTTAVTEEVLFRGYVIERLAELTGRLWPAVVFSLLVFVVPHVGFFGPSWLLTNGPGVALLYVLYVWRRNLVACMVMHLVGNSLLLVPALGLA